RLISWTGKTVGIKAIHFWHLEPRDGGTLVRTEESYEGFMARLFRGRLKKTLDAALTEGLSDLKREVERRAAEEECGRPSWRAAHELRNAIAPTRRSRRSRRPRGPMNRQRRLFREPLPTSRLGCRWSESARSTRSQWTPLRRRQHPRRAPASRRGSKRHS